MTSTRPAIFAMAASLAAVVATLAAAAQAPANMRALMVDTVGPATAPIWEFGYADRVTDEDWARIRQAATTLVGSLAAISSGGRVAAEQARAKDPAWQDWTEKLSDAANAAKAAAGAKDQMGLATAGDSMVEICEGCHMAFDPTARQ